jgi:late competence protein required for DNA uptake (superfamily II DNA/RNA helicase)
MNQTEKENCQICGDEISVEESYLVDDVRICDDCYLEKSQRVIACNPLVTYSAKRFQDSDGVEAKERLNDTQKAIFDFIKSEGKVTIKDLSEKFNLSKTDTENQVAILRHLELTKAKKVIDKIYIVPF